VWHQEVLHVITIAHALVIRCALIALFSGALWGIIAGSQALEALYSQPMAAAEFNSPRSLPLSHWKNLPDPGEPQRYLEYRQPQRVPPAVVTTAAR
jgi:hypothetical protein